jgi:hypothetical protein
MTSCFIDIFVSIAASQDVKLDKLNDNAEYNMNLAKTFGIADVLIIEDIFQN